MGIITEYLTLQEKFQKQYGERTVLVYQIGSFYEIYSFDPSHCPDDNAKIDHSKTVWNKSIGHAVELSIVLNIMLTNKDNSKPYGIRNPNMIGFPTIAWEKNKITLLANDFVIVRMDQAKEKSSSEEVTRFVAEVASPSLEIDNIPLTRSSSNIVCLYIEYQAGKNIEDFLITAGVAVIDVITGSNRICEFYSKTEDSVSAIHDLFRFLIAHYPREIIIHLNDFVNSQYQSYLEHTLELRRFDRVIFKINETPPDFKKIPYQIECFNKYFTENVGAIKISNVHIIKELGLDKQQYGRIAYLLLLQHCHSHKFNIVRKLSKPDLEWIDEKKHLVLTHNAIVQLDIISSTPKKTSMIDSLMSILDHTRTVSGRRALLNILQNPMLNSADINIYYNAVDEMITSNLWSDLDNKLRELPDIARLQRKLQMKIISPKELAILFRSYLKVINIYISVVNSGAPTLISQLFSSEHSTSFNNFITRYSKLLNFEALDCCYIDEDNLEFDICPIREGEFKDIDDQAKHLANVEVHLNKIIEYLNGFITIQKGQKLSFKAGSKKRGAVKQEISKSLIITTVSKANSLLKAQYDPLICGVLNAIPLNTTEKIISSDKIDQLCEQIDVLKVNLRKSLLDLYNSIIEEMNVRFNFYIALNQLIAKLDLWHSYAKVAVKNNYFKPVIVDQNNSFLEAIDVRHPIIEKIINGQYVTNDITLNGDGMLLFGVNQAGKSSLAKALGLIIVMAQAGCWVPAKLKYQPYSKIITRLTKTDNLFAGESTFCTELSELRTILRNANQNTLVLGDELCASTETHSGSAITAATLIQLIQRKVSFMFSTHMHELLKLSYIKNLKGLRICHLAVAYDEATQILTYDRKIKDGSGESIYGLIVARSLNLPPDFLDLANEILLEVIGINQQIVDTKQSRYNTQVYVDSCAICNKNKQEIELHTHHILEQHLAKNGLIGNMPKNKKDNLITLCRNCHNKLHNEGKELVTVEIGNGLMVKMK